MSIPFKKYGYTLNPMTNEYSIPQIFLVDKRLHKIGELYPVQDLSITINEINQADEISFTYYRTVNETECPHFDKIDDLSVIEVADYGYFELAVDKNETNAVTKKITGISLAHAELSQILATLEINTDDDMARTDYDEDYPTILYRDPGDVSDTDLKEKYRNSSLLHRILTYAPHYRIGSVSDTLKQKQRTFSWKDADIVTILNAIAEEIDCVFDIDIHRENGIPQRIIHVYDLEDIGMDTNIFLSTDYLSDEISIRGNKDSIKNCFKIVGGDDMITDTVNGLTMSASNTIMMFSEKQKKEMSTGLKSAIEKYDREYGENIGDYEKLLETEYNIMDMKHYLRSSKMPPLEKEIIATDMAVFTVLNKISTYYQNQFFINQYQYYKDYSYQATQTSIQNLFTTFMPEGYSFTADCDSITKATETYDPSVSYQWYGTIRVYSTGNRDEYYTIHLKTDSQTYLTFGEKQESYEFSDQAIQNVVTSFKISFSFADQSQSKYIDYIDQHTKYILSTYDLSYENEKNRPWDQYSYHRLKSFQDGYQKCIDTLEGMNREEIADTKTAEIISDMITSYKKIQKDIMSQMSVLLDQLFALSTYHGEFDHDFVDDKGNVTYMLQYYRDIQTVFDHLVDPGYKGGYKNETYQVNEYIGTEPLPGSPSYETDTCLDIMNNICSSYNNHKNDSITNMREAYRKRFARNSYLNDELYAELRSFIREDVYTNENYISDGLNNTQIIERAKELKAKAAQELAKACVPEYTVEAPLSSIVGQKSFLYQGVLVNDDYSDFTINNFVRVRIDDELYKMRIASIRYTFPVTDRIEVTFTNVTRHNSSMLRDVTDLLNEAKSMATSYSYVAKQAEKGSQTGKEFDSIKKEGLDTALIAVKGGRDQDIVMDDHGILLRRKIQETNMYSQYQMKLIDRNIVMTKDNWETAELAIGLGRYQGELLYGIWADLLRGDLIVGNELIISNQDENGNYTVQINKEGIDITNGSIKITNENGCTVTIDPMNTYKEGIVFGISKNGEDIVNVDNQGNAVFNGIIHASDGSFVGEVTAGSGWIGGQNTGWKITEDSITNTGNGIIRTTNAADSNAYTEIRNGCIAVSGMNGGMLREAVLQNGNALFSGDGHWITIDNDMIRMGHGSIGNNLWLIANIHDDFFRLGTDTTKTDLYGSLNIHGTTHFPNNESVYFGSEVQLFNGCRPSDRKETLFCSSGIFTAGAVAIGDEFTGSTGKPYMLSVDGSIKVAKEVYTNGGTALTSDQNKKHDIEDPDERYLDLFDRYEVKRFKYNDGTSDRYHLGAVAQSVEDAMEDAGINTQEFAGLIKDGDDYYLRYDELNMLTALKVKSMAEEIELLKNEIKELREVLAKTTKDGDDHRNDKTNKP